MGKGIVAIGARGYISASQVANLFGAGYGSPYEMYCRYKGIETEADKPSDQAVESMEFGTFFEDAVARYASMKLGYGRLNRCGETAYWNDSRPYFICHPDRLVIKKVDGRRVALEVKCVQPYAEGWGEDGSSEIPDRYFFQVQSYYACEVPCDLVVVVCLKGNRVSFHPIEKDDEIVDAIISKVEQAHADFEAGNIPDSANYKEEMSKYKGSVRWQDEGKGANDEALQLHAQLRQLSEQAKEIEARQDELKRELTAYIGDAPSLITIDGKKVKKLAYWVNKEGKARLDVDGLRVDHPDVDVDMYFIKGEPSRYIQFNFR